MKTGWWGIAAFVAAYDTWAGISGHKTLSTEFRENSRIHPIAITATAGYLMLHLYGFWPRKADPLTQYCLLLGRTLPH